MDRRKRVRRIVLTGGPGAGKTAVLELVRQHFGYNVRILPEAASLLFRGGFPRGTALRERQASQRAIFFVERELERWAEAVDGTSVVLCDRGTVDGLAYWPGPEREFWRGVGSTKEKELARYDVVLHLRTPSLASEYNHRNALRTEDLAAANAIDARLVRAWNGHPRRHFIESRPRFMDKALEALRLLRAEVAGAPPGCVEADG